MPHDDLKKPLDVPGYTAQPQTNIDRVRIYKAMEERVLREVDAAQATMWPTERNDVHAYDPRWLAVARTHFQEGFMALNRAVFQPARLTDEELKKIEWPV